MGRTAFRSFQKISYYEINFYYLLSLPDGIYVRAFEDRMDLYSVMIKGPQNTPYEGIYRFIFMHCQIRPSNLRTRVNFMSRNKDSYTSDSSFV